MSPAFNYILATTADIALIIKYRFALLNTISGEQDAAITAALKQSLETYFQKAIADKTYICWMAMDGNELAAISGMAVWPRPASYERPCGLSGYIMGIYTLPQYRKQGICSALVEKLEDTAREMQLDNLELHATDEGEPIYRKHGFKEPKTIVLEKSL
jgi:GNAT superfamily N-acetyltransferase